MSTVISEAARVLSKLGASKGGKRSMETMTPRQRSARAKKAAIARWANVAKKGKKKA